MEAKKIILSALIATSFLYSADANIKDLTEMQNFYYQKGYNDASEKFYKSGYEQAVFDLTKQMQKYRKIIDSYEAGKYYMSQNKITFPKIFRTKDANGNYVVQIETPEIQEKLTLEDIFVLPELDRAGNYSSRATTPNFSSSSSYRVGAGDDNIINNPAYSAKTNAIHPARANTSPVGSPISIMKEFGVSFPKTDRIKRVFESGNIKFVETPSEYKGYFRNKDDFELFCQNVSGDKQCSNLMQN